MTREQLDLLIELIDAKIEEAKPQTGADEGLSVSILIRQIETELYGTLGKYFDTYNDNKD